MKRPYRFIFLLIVTVLFPSGMLSASPNPSAMKGLFSRGSTAYQDGNYQEALGRWKEALEIAEQIGDKRVIGIFAANIGLAHAKRGEYERALEFHEKALRMNREIGDKGNSAINLNNIGAVYNDMGRHDRALEYYREALVIRRETKDRNGEANLLSNMGVVFSDSGCYKDAFKSLNAAVGVYRDLNDTLGEISVLKNLGVVYTRTGQYPDAMDAYQKALAMIRAINDPRTEAILLSNIGGVHIQLKEYPNALECYQKSLDIQRKSGNRHGIGNDLSNLGVVHKRLKAYDNALANYREALEIKRSLGDRLNEGAILGNIGLVCEEMGRYEEAMESMVASHQICQEFNLPEYLWRALRGRGKVEARLGKNDDAIRNYTLALDTIENMREGLAEKELKTAFMQDKYHVYDELTVLLSELHAQDPSKGYDWNAFEVFERKQGRVFLEEMGKSGARNFSGIPVEVVAEETRLEMELLKIRAAMETQEAGVADKEREQLLREKAEGLENRLLAVRETIRNQYPDYDALKYPEPVDLDHLRKSVLGRGELLLVYDVMENATCLWAIGKDHFSLQRIDLGNAPLTAMVHAYRDNSINFFRGEKLRGAPAAPVAKSSATEKKRSLHDLLFPGTVPEIMNGYSTVYIVPTGPLYLLPFEALKDGSGRYLVEHHAFAYLSSGSLLNVLRTAQARRETAPRYPFLAFANPVYDMPKQIDDTVEELQVRSFYSLMRGAIEPLPETEDEVTQIRNILMAPEASNPLRIQRNASRSVVFDLNAKGNLDDYQYISFACHGIIPDEVNGISQPSLLLSTPDPATNDVGLLTMADVFGLKLNADLVALSACNTARGDMITGEGVIGLTRAFMYAGTPSITVNLWSVETVSAQKLSVSYFEELRQGKKRAEALREAKLRLLRGESGETFKSPFFWAPTILFGDGM